MARETRHQFLASLGQLPRLFGRKRPRVERAKREPVPIKRWSYSFPTAGSPDGVVEAYTRSEARARIKQLHGLSRLPPGITIWCEGAK